MRRLRICASAAFVLTHSYLVTAFSPSKSQFLISNALHAAHCDGAITRQEVLKKISLVPFIWSIGNNFAEAKTKVSSVTPENAFVSIVKSREELQSMSKKFLPSKNFKGMREYLADETLNINRYEENANALLSSKRLDAESKKEIGTIRRYGIGADVIIMYGGLRAEIDEENESPDYSTVSKAIKRTMDSLDEIILICRSNGLE